MQVHIFMRKKEMKPKQKLNILNIFTFPSLLLLHENLLITIANIATNMPLNERKLMNNIEHDVRKSLNATVLLQVESACQNHKKFTDLIKKIACLAF